MPYKDKEKQRACWTRYHRSQKAKARKKAWLQENPEKKAKYAAAQRARKAADPEGYRTYFRNRYVMKKYRVPARWYDETLKAQGGGCAICGGPPDIKIHGITRLAIDHDHKTDQVRALLCNGCNVGIGSLGDDPERIEAAAKYVRKWRTNG